ncbi:MAG: ATP-binding cassette domain-containing protein, partial [Streptococcus parauberis]
MTDKIIELIDASLTINNGFDETKTILDNVNLTIRQGDFITILGGNGAGKSTLFNVIAGTLFLSKGQIRILGQDVTHMGAEKRAVYLARVFQDPKMGTAPRMTVAENLLIAEKRGQKRQLTKRTLAHR